MTMASDTLETQGLCRSAEALKPEPRRELKRLLNRLKSELAELSKTHNEQARSISGFAQVAAHEATRTGQNPRLLSHALDGLKASVEEFEASHPKLVQTVGAITNLLASMGI